MPPTPFRPQAVVVDAGDFPTHPLPLALIDGCDRVVCCDGAVREFIDSGRIPWRIVGDCDSIPPELKERFSDIVRRFPDQETNDQTKAVRYLKTKGFKRIAITGATGRREDHTLGNLSLLIDYLEEGLEVRTYTDHGVFIPYRDGMTLHLPVGTQVSIFNFGATALRAEGLRYPIRDFDRWWQGTLNETTQPTVTIHARGLLLLYHTY